MTVRNVSQGGFLLSASRRFEARTVLHVELPAVGDSVPLTVLARVQHVAEEQDGTWALRWVFARALADDELHALLEA